MKQPKTESLNQSSRLVDGSATEIEAPATLVVMVGDKPTSTDFEWQRSLWELNETELMEYEERAAIMEYDGGLPACANSRQVKGRSGEAGA